MNHPALIDEAFRSLEKYCRGEDFKGWDPFDGLNSRLFQATPLRRSRLARLAWLQLFKRNPLNLRPLVGVPKQENAKGLALFLHGYCLWQRWEPSPEKLRIIEDLVERILRLKSPGFSGNCWGYNFDWQARAFFQPRATPTVVATSFVGQALAEAYALLGREPLRQELLAIAPFLLKDLNRSVDAQGDFAFSYSPLDRTQVFNASLLGSRMLARLCELSPEPRPDWLEAARRSASFCAKHQRPNGAWPYGTLPFHQWVDNFHTAYNLECLHEYQRVSGDRAFEANIRRGLDYFLANFFTPKGESKYYDNSLYPIDIHAPAQLVVCLSRLGLFERHRELVERVLGWTLQNMRTPKGFFIYQKKKIFSSKIPYMRWAQAWMFYGLSFYLWEVNRMKPLP